MRSGGINWGQVGSNGVRRSLARSVGVTWGSGVQMISGGVRWSKVWLGKVRWVSKSGARSGGPRRVR